MYELLGKVAPSSVALTELEFSSAALGTRQKKTAINQQLDLPQLDADDECVLIAESMHQPFWLESEHRMEKLGQVYDALGKPKDLIVMLCCDNFLSFLELWLQSCADNKIEVHHRTIVFTLDQDADSRVSKLGLKSYLLNPDIYQRAGAAQTYADDNFLRTMFYKNAIILECLKLGANILFQDVDLIWLKDPLNFLPQQNPESQLQIMYDGVNARHYPLYANTGFFYLRNTPVSHVLVETALRNTAAIFALAGHQPPFNRICAHFADQDLLNVVVLPESEYLNGHLFNTVTGLKEAALNWRTDGIVIHYSWNADNAGKIRKLEKFDYFNRAKPTSASTMKTSNCKVTVHVDGLDTLEFYADPESPVFQMLRHHLSTPNDNQLIYLNYGANENDALYFMSSDLLSVNTDQAN